MLVELKPHQKPVIDQIHNGCVLIGGVGSGKTVTALAYCWTKEFGGVMGDLGSAKTPTDIYVFTTARKRDSQDWQNWAMRFGISVDPEASVTGTRIVVESYNNMSKYDEIEGAFVIFDEQRVVGSGAWSKSFVKIAKKNRWIMLSATPGDVPEDYIPLFIANGFYKNRTEFKREHCVYSYYGKFPRLERYLNMRKFERLRDSILVDMPYEKHTKRHIHEVPVEYDKELFDKVVKKRWHVYENRPLKDVSELFAVMRKVVNSDASRIATVEQLLQIHPRLIVFYNFDYELEILRTLGNTTVLTVPTASEIGSSQTSANISVRGTSNSSRKSLGTLVDTDSITSTTSHISENNSSDWFLKNPNRSESPASRSISDQKGPGQTSTLKKITKPIAENTKDVIDDPQSYSIPIGTTIDTPSKTTSYSNGDTVSTINDPTSMTENGFRSSSGRCDSPISTKDTTKNPTDTRKSESWQIPKPVDTTSSDKESMTIIKSTTSASVVKLDPVPHTLLESTTSSTSTSTSGSKFQLAEWNGHKHEDVPDSPRWAYLVQYVAGAEAWNCTITNAIAFWSRTYSYKNEQQAMGRIDRLDTPFVNLHYYFLMSRAPIDRAIARALANKHDFNERKFLGR